MDFATAPFVTDAIRKRCENEVLGYTGKPDSYYNEIIEVLAKRMRVCREIGTFKKEPVSYTHLDVYKRQSLPYPLSE